MRVNFVGMMFWVFGLCATLQAQTLPEGFRDEVVIGGLSAPTSVRFAPDGRIFVAEKAGLVKVFEGFGDHEPSILADLTIEVNSYRDRGLLGLALDPGFPQNPFVYVFYTYDAPPGQTAPVWNDTCPTPPGDVIDGCVVSSRLTRLEVGPGNHLVESVPLVTEGWCHQFPSHSAGALAFGLDGALYVSAGDGGNFRPDSNASGADYGQRGGSLPGTPTPSNPCNDPPLPSGALLTPPTAEGGALRSQDLQTPGDPLSFDGAIVRVDSADGPANAIIPQIVAFGLRNPFRMTAQPQTGEIWLGDVGSQSWEEINRIPDPGGKIENFGWPCFEGESRQSIYEVLGLTLCENLYADESSTTPPFFAYSHAQPPKAEDCQGPANRAAISGLAFYSEGDYPDAYEGALFFSDFSQACIWTIFPDDEGVLQPDTLSTLVAQAAEPVDLQIGPGGDLFYVDLIRGQIHRITYTEGLIFGDGFETGTLIRWSQVEDL